MVDERTPPHDLQTRTEAEGATVDLPEGLGFFTTGQVLGERYEILEMLGRGGMGEVWRAFDLKLRVEVGLKALRDDLFQSERRLELLRQEVRAAREVVSPNVCRIFDLIEIDGRELVSMEYVDGATLLGVLQERGPLELKEAQDIASQFLAGLEAIHKAGLVHRDVKPENIMLTRAGRVVVMDFGLARGPESGAGSVSGTPAYMAPEHAAGQEVDARADVYSAGVVLAEMVSPDGIKSYESRQSLWEGVRSEPAQIPDSPWAPVIKRAVARDRERRQNSAHTLIRELEDVTLRVEGAEDLHPYPGLASFTEDDNEYFFGREAEVERMWRKLEGPPRMLALVGPSGAGKSSFLQAGLISHAGAGWRCVISKPGTNPVLGLSRALAPEMSGDVEAMDLLLRFDDPEVAMDVVSRWRRTTEHALIVVDQFEELFTQNAADEQRRFADLLGRLVLEADVFVILSMRDDFMMRSHDLEALEPIFSEMTALPALAGGSLRRALVRPATTCGYRFEDDELVEEVLTEVEGDRGALPMLAFAAARLWEKRDRETGHLTRQAYHDIGGVGGALARHAEATVDRIGVERIPIVRELFRNLVTAEGTRAVREWDELLSVFEGENVRRLEGEKVKKRERINIKRIDESPCDAPSHSERSERSLSNSSLAREAASEVLRKLIDARLLTSYEVHEDEHQPTRRVEIIHESLLANWPRLVRWQTQDADGTRLRDELRQSARMWEEHDRSNDLLWTGTAFREFAVWRERYPGGLSELEERFARAMTAHARRRRRRRRTTVAAAFLVLLAVLAVVGVSRQQAVAETNRAEASKLVALGREVLATSRTDALAYAIASLDRSDTAEGRRLALRSLWAGPPVSVPPLEFGPQALAISPDGQFLAVGGGNGVVWVLPRDGGSPIDFQAFDEGSGLIFDLAFSADGRWLVGGASNAEGEVRVWRTGDWQLEASLQSPEPPDSLRDNNGLSYALGRVEPDSEHVVTLTFRYTDPARTNDRGHWVARRWPLDGGPAELLGEVAATLSPFASLDLARGRLAVSTEHELHLHRLDALGREPPRVIGPHTGGPIWGTRLAFDPGGERLATCDVDRILRVWPLDGDGSEPEVELEALSWTRGTVFSRDGSRIAITSHVSGGLLWDLTGPAHADPVTLGVRGHRMQEVAFTPHGDWLAASSYGGRGGVSLWPQTHRHRTILRHRDGDILKLGGVHPDGSRLFVVVAERDGLESLVSWPLSGGIGAEPEVIFRGVELALSGVAVDGRGRFVVVGSYAGVHMIPLDGGAPTMIEGIPRLGGLNLDPTGRYLAKCAHHIVDLETLERITLDLPEEEGCRNLGFDDRGRMVTNINGVVMRWDPEFQDSEILISEGARAAIPFRDGHRLFLIMEGVDDSRIILDLDDGSRKPLNPAHQRPSSLYSDRDFTVVASGHPDGEVRVGSPFDEEPHLLVGHGTGSVDVVVSPDGSWVASLGPEGTIFIWPIPDLSKPPLHTLPLDQLLDTLRRQTNLRVFVDETSPSGYGVESDPTAYHGWAEVPEW